MAKGRERPPGAFQTRTLQSAPTHLPGGEGSKRGGKQRLGDRLHPSLGGELTTCLIYGRAQTWASPPLLAHPSCLCQPHTHTHVSARTRAHTHTEQGAGLGDVAQSSPPPLLGKTCPCPLAGRKGSMPGARVQAWPDVCTDGGHPPHSPMSSAVRWPLSRPPPQ